MLSLNVLAVVDAVDAPDGARLSGAGTAPRDGRKARPLGGFARPLHIVHRGDDDAERADVGGVLDVPFLGVGQADHRNGAGVRAGGDHRLHVLELQRAVLHFEPGVVVVLGRFAVAGDVELTLREAEDLLAFQQLLLGGVVEFRLGRLRRGRATEQRQQWNQADRG